jgi:hypothetical protein
MTCFFCRWSDVEASTGWGHLARFVEQGAEYDSYFAAGKTPKWVASALRCLWVDEWHSYERWVLRPKDYGYRGRP